MLGNVHLPRPALWHQPFPAQSALQIASKSSSLCRKVHVTHGRPCVDLTLSKAVAMTPDQFKTELIGLLPRLRRFALSLTRSGPDADDLLQDACAAALQKWEQYDPAQPLDRWMFRILRNMWISEIRRRKTRQGEGQIPAEEAAELRTEDTAADDLTARQVRGKVENLDQDLAQPLLLVCAEGYSYREVAELLSIPIGTVMSRIHRARKLLISSLSDVEQVVK